MLLDLLIRHPSALVQLIQKTPYWVWALLIGLIGLGASQLRTRQVSQVRAMVMPLAMTALSIYGITSAFGGSGRGAAAVGAWLAAAAAMACAALWLQPDAPAGTLYTPRLRSFCVPGSAMPLALILGIFLTKYFVGVELAMQPGLARDGTFALQIAALYGMFNGVFAARALRLWRLARRPQSPDAPAGAAVST